MRILLDTHYLLWALDKPARLRQDVRAAIELAANEVLFSAASIWELAIKSALRGGAPDLRPGRIAEAARMTGLTELPVTALHAAGVADLPMHHRDPFDRLLIAQAISLPARLLTPDGQLPRYSDLVWLLPPATAS